MSVTSISFNFFNMVGAPAAAAPVAPAAPAAGAPAPAVASCEGHGNGRRNVLYEAMMAALREMGLTPRESAPAAPTAPTAAPSAGAPIAPAPTPIATTSATAPSAPAAPAAAPAAPQPTSVEDAVFSFAHALWQALRGDGERRWDRGDRDGEHRHRRHDHDHDHGHRASRSYSGLAGRLEALATRLDGAAGSPPAPAAPMGATETQPVAPTSAPAVTEPQAQAAVANPAPVAVPSSPLAEAFDAMMKVLRALDPSAPRADAPLPSLATFLHSLARGLGGERTTPVLSGVGVMINVSA